MTYDDTSFLFGCTLATLSRIIADCLKRKGRVLLCVGQRPRRDSASQPQDRLQVGLARAFRRVPYF
jgi:hypothetical protein